MIKFGTDGWRDIIADRFTFENVRIVAQAYARHILRQGGKRVVVGHDTRFLADRFAAAAAQTLAANGLEVYLSGCYVPTPVLSFAVKHLQADGGVMLSASHNPPEYCGFKLKGAYGGSATPEMVKDVERHLGETPAVFDPAQHTVQTFDVQEAYYQHLSDLLDLETLRRFTGTFYHDSMGGAGCGWISGFLKHARLDGIKLQELHATPNPMFYGVNPEPLPQNLAETMQVMQSAPVDSFAAVTDGDADRIGAVVAGGQFFNSHQIFAVLLRHLHDRGLRGRVVQTVSVSGLIAALSEKLGLEVTTTPIGFKYITEEMLQGDILIGGEESGGLGVKGHLPERDGILNGLLMMEAVARSGKSLSELFREVEDLTGLKHAYDRIDLKLPSLAIKDQMMQKLNTPGPVAGREVLSIDTRDGIKWFLQGGAWVMFRASGTEPVLRVYAEAGSEEAVQEILQAALHLLGA
ncbi:phosphoglucomutase/phosphomannomutase family protein [Deinococcus cellulosilyticus]|uniref:Phosphohexose mutase n=1 Tax=Deinococcus cellulosilyticus (strain DSM 18568 / NBRC 106333 / KACC 11606 / 5516J-15) TaxID=1223518 RepID=A0A511MYM5_DEIC1|nr:phosphoglucomutase/phosphomannomutase family protein [Deinococcus cellulosilyticus]GEM45256.1 phosphohexose mutase [Deinococcus cellulosilyticus NBRC 106333 = KACC 11606]